jgi:hypothetical protein
LIYFRLHIPSRFNMNTKINYLRFARH